MSGDMRVICRTGLCLAVAAAALLAFASVGSLAQPTSVPASQPASASAGAEANWPCFRGPNYGGLALNAGDPPAKIDLTRDVRWRESIPEGGNGSPIIWGDRVYVTGGLGHVIAFDRATGKQLWDTALKVPPAVETPEDKEGPPEAGDAGPASATPVTDGKFVYASFADSSLGCVDAGGKQVWVKRLVQGRAKNVYGLASSPLLYGDLVIQVIDRGTDPDAKLSFITALRAKDGTEVWRKDRPVSSSWTSPILVHGPGGDAVVTSGNPLVIAYNPKTGEELWRADGQSGEVSVSPVPCGEGAVAVISDGMSAFKLGGKGDITKTGKLWSSDASTPQMSSPACDGKRLYQVASSGLVCLDAATGKEKWTLELEGEFWGSLALAKDRIYLVSHDGNLFVASNEGKKLCQVDLQAGVPSTPAILDGRIYIRASGELICIGKP